MSSKIYDISMYITNELPRLCIADSLIVTVNNRKSTILLVQAMINETERKAAAGDLPEEDNTEYAMMDDALKLLIGKEATEEINALDLPLPEYKRVYNAIMALAIGEDPDRYNMETP